MKPNLFQFATSELSQDAILCWLAAWGDPRFRENDVLLHGLGQKFLKALFEKHGRKLPEISKPIELKRQHRNIDILLIINDTIAVCIEDKVGSTEHSNQLQRYLDGLIDDNFSEEQIVPVYIQTGDQGSYKAVKSAGYEVMRRRELLGLLQTYREQGGTNSIIQDFHDYLSTIEREVEAFRAQPLSSWTPYAWQGFYSELQSQLGDGEWSYVANPSGGFLGYWWHWHRDSNSEVYLQIEQERLCFRISIDDTDKRGDQRSIWLSRILAAAKESNLNVVRPARLGSGQTMTVAILGEDYRVLGNRGIIDIDKTIAVLRSASVVLDRAVVSSRY